MTAKNSPIAPSTFLIAFDCSGNLPAGQAASRITSQRTFRRRYLKRSMVIFSAAVSVPFNFSEGPVALKVPEKLIDLLSNVM
jgi:hypothetical protein